MSQQNDSASRETSHVVQLFQDAHQKMVMLKRVDEQMAQLQVRRRTLMDELRSAGEITGGPKPFSARDRSEFLSALHNAIVRLKRAGFVPGGA